MKTKLLSVLLAMLSAIATAADLYVSPRDGGTFSGEGVYSSLNDAVTAAVAGDVIHLENGHYGIGSQIVLDKAVSIVSDGERDKTIVYSEETSTTYLFKLTSSSAVVSNICIYGINPFSEAEDKQTSNGGGVYITGGTVVDCVISSHKYAGRVGAVKFYGSGRAAGLVDRCIITNNYSSGECGAVFIQAGTLRNSLIAYNGAKNSGSALFAYLSNCNVHNNTFANNTNTATSGEITIRYNGNAPDLRGNICYNNRTGTGNLDTNVRSDIYLETKNLYNPDGDIFIDADGGDFHLNPDYSDISLIEDRFAPDEYLASFPFGALDLDRNERAVKDMVDMGCYELQLRGLSCHFDITRNGTFDSDRVVLSANVYGVLDGTNCTWEVVNRTDSSAEPLVMTGSQVAAVYSLGVYDVTLTVRNAKGDIAVSYVPDAFSVLPKNVYVHPAGSNEAPFDSFDNALTNLSYVLSQALSGQVIYLTDGEYPLDEGKIISKQMTIESLGDAAKTLIYSANSPLRAILTLSAKGSILRNVTISGVTPEGVLTSTHGGVVLGERTLIEDCIVTGHSGGFALSLNHYTVVADRCHVVSNYHGGVRFGSGIIRNSLILNNMGGEGCAIHISSKDTYIYNCTVALNRGGLSIRKGTVDNEAYFVGNVFYNNSISEGVFDDYTSYYSKFGILDGRNIINPDASVFVDAESGDFHLNKEAAAEAGMINLLESSDYTSALGDYDAEGCERVVSGLVDVGAYETQVPIAVTMEVERAGNIEVDTVTLKAVLSGVDYEGATYSWKVVNTAIDGDEGIIAEGVDKASFTHNYSVGHYQVTVTATNPNGDSDTKVYDNAFAVMPRVVYVSATGSETAPFDSVEKGLRDITFVLDNIQDGQTIYLDEGTYEIGKTLVMDGNYSIIGVGRPEKTIFYAPKALGARMVNFSHVDALIEGVMLLGTNGVGDVTTSGAVSMTAGTLRNCIVTGHSYGNDVGAIDVNGPSVIDRCVVTNNTASGRVGAFFVKTNLGKPMIMNSLIAYNTSNGDGSVFFIFNSDACIYNCTVAYNKTTKDNGQGHTIRFGPNSAKMVGSVFYKNMYNDEIDTYHSPITGNNVLEPEAKVFVDAEGGDFRLSEEAANTNMVNRFAASDYPNGITTFDLDGKPRFADELADVGCYEKESATLAASLSMTRIGGTSSDPITFEASVSGGNSAGATYVWTITNTVNDTIAMIKEGVDLVTFTETLSHGHYASALTITPTVGEAVTVAGPTFVVFSPKVYIIPDGEDNPYDEDADGMVFTSINEVTGEDCSGVTIYLAEGWYPIIRQVSIANDLKIIGIGDKEKTCIYPKSGVNAGMPLFVVRNGGARIENVTLTGLNKAGARHAEARAISISNGEIENVIITDFRGNGSGSGIYMTGGTVSKTTIRRTTSANGITGLALYIASGASSAHVVDCIIEGNKIGTTSAITTSNGAGAAAYAGVIERTLFRVNNAQYGSALFAGGTASIRSCVFDGNLASLDYGEMQNPGYATILVDSEGATICNCTVVNNKVRGTAYSNVAGVWVRGATSLAKANVQNTIIIGNTSVEDGTEHNVRHPDGLGGGTEDRYNFYTCVTTEDYGQDAVTEDGRLSGRASNPYAIPAKSKWRDAGINEDWMQEALDYCGNPRIEGPAVDIGACENQRPFGTLMHLQ